jgi:hypothetical protein
MGVGMHCQMPLPQLKEPCPSAVVGFSILVGVLYQMHVHSVAYGVDGHPTHMSVHMHVVACEQGSASRRRTVLVNNARLDQAPALARNLATIRAAGVQGSWWRGMVPPITLLFDSCSDKCPTTQTMYSCMRFMYIQTNHTFYMA